MAWLGRLSIALVATLPPLAAAVLPGGPPPHLSTGHLMRRESDDLEPPESLSSPKDPVCQSWYAHNRYLLRRMRDNVQGKLNKLLEDDNLNKVYLSESCCLIGYAKGWGSVGKKRRDEGDILVYSSRKKGKRAQRMAEHLKKWIKEGQLQIHDATLTDNGVQYTKSMDIGFDDKRRIFGAHRHYVVAPTKSSVKEEVLPHCEYLPDYRDSTQMRERVQEKLDGMYSDNKVYLRPRCCFHKYADDIMEGEQMRKNGYVVMRTYLTGTTESDWAAALALEVKSLVDDNIAQTSTVTVGEYERVLDVGFDKHFHTRNLDGYMVVLPTKKFYEDASAEARCAAEEFD